MASVPAPAAWDLEPVTLVGLDLVPGVGVGVLPLGLGPTDGKRKPPVPPTGLKPTRQVQAEKQDYSPLGLPPLWCPSAAAVADAVLLHGR